MTIQISPRVAPFIRIELVTDDHPELDRAIALPRNAPNEWAIDAYLLSIGRVPLGTDDHLDYAIDEFDSPRFDPWNTGRRPIAIPELEHRVNIVVREADPPPIGSPLVSVSALGRTEGQWKSGDWLTDVPPFRADDVNRELVQRFGVVTPYFEDLDLAAVDPSIHQSSRLNAVLRALTPVRRLSLLAHIDAAGLLRADVADLAIVESAVAPLRLLFDRLGPNGRSQDPTNGWIPDTEVKKLSRSLGWSDGSGDSAPAAAALIAFTRRAKLIRRIKGRVVATARGRQLTEPTTRTLENLSGLLVESARGYSAWRSPRRTVDSALALLAIADGTATNLDDLAHHVSVGAIALNTDDPWNDDARWQTISAKVNGAPRETGEGELEQIKESLGCLSLRNEYGVITPAMREVARYALT